MDSLTPSRQVEPVTGRAVWATPTLGSRDTFDDDLLWIVDKLVARTGGEFGFLMCCGAGAAAPEILADAHTPPGLAAEIAGSIADELPSWSVGAKSAAGAGIHQGSLPISSPAAASVRAMALHFRPTERVTILAIVCRPDGEQLFTALQQQVASLLFPVLARYIRLWWLHRTERRLVHALHGALDLTDTGLMLLGRGGELLLANEKATALLERKDGLRHSDGSISACRHEDALKLHAAIRHAVQCNVDVDAPEGGPARAAVVALERPLGNRKLLIAVVAARRPAIDAHDPAVVVYMLDPQPDIGSLLGPVCALYKLSAAETRLVHRLARGLSLNEAAAEMRVQPLTARTYLRQVFAKTDTHRQSDLMRLVFSSLLRTAPCGEFGFLAGVTPQTGMQVTFE